MEDGTFASVFGFFPVRACVLFLDVVASVVVAAVAEDFDTFEDPAAVPDWEAEAVENCCCWVK